MKKIFVLFLLLYTAFTAYKLIFSPTFFYDWDESLYIQTGKEIFERPFFLFPVWQGEPWLDKPPLVPFVYGAVMNVFYFIRPEISTRLFTLAIAVVVLIFTYMLFLKASKERWIALLTVVITAFTPTFLQRAQVVNLDLFLLLGWLGYILFFNRFWISAFFLIVAVLSKSLLGFYPIAIMFIFYLFLLWRKKIQKRDFQKAAAKLAAHAGIGASWFIAMLLIYQQQFFTQHIVESHFRRVTASIESHFGKRTFYLDLIIQEFGIFIWLAIAGCIWLLFQLKKKTFDDIRLVYSIYLLPWFIFLNLTKTKIFWYIYPVLPQFAFLSALPLIMMKKTKILYYAFGVVMIVYVFSTVFVTQRSFYKKYSNNRDPHYALAAYARDHCNRLIVVENPESRKAYDTLSKLGLVITTTNWWGSHPSLVYYFGKKVDFIYSEDVFAQKAKSIFSQPKNCIAVSVDDQLLSEVKKKNAVLLKRYSGGYQLFQSPHTTL